MLNLQLYDYTLARYWWIHFCLPAVHAKEEGMFMFLSLAYVTMSAVVCFTHHMLLSLLFVHSSVCKPVWRQGHICGPGDRRGFSRCHRSSSRYDGCVVLSQTEAVKLAEAKLAEAKPAVVEVKNVCGTLFYSIKLSISLLFWAVNVSFTALRYSYKVRSVMAERKRGMKAVNGGLHTL